MIVRKIRSAIVNGSTPEKYPINIKEIADLASQSNHGIDFVIVLNAVLDGNNDRICTRDLHTAVEQ